MSETTDHKPPLKVEKLEEDYESDSADSPTKRSLSIMKSSNKKPAYQQGSIKMVQLPQVRKTTECRSSRPDLTVISALQGRDSELARPNRGQCGQSLAAQPNSGGNLLLAAAAE